MDFQRIFDLIRWLDEVLNQQSIRFDSITPSVLPSEGAYISFQMFRKEIRRFFILVTQAISRIEFILINFKVTNWLPQSR